MLEHARSGYEDEVCGLVGGNNNLAISIYPVKNIADDLKHKFLMEPQEQIEAMRRMRESDEEMIGIYHSHPDSTAEPSATDLEMAAYPDIFYFIISLGIKNSKLVCFYYDGLSFKRIRVNAI